MDAGLALKAVAGRHVSLLVFGAAQIAMDIEPLIGMLRGQGDLHGITHTYAGAAVIGLLVFWLAPYLCNPILRRYNQEARALRLPWLACDERISPHAAALGAFLGSFSHVALDSLMHADMQPFWPLSASNALLFLVDIDSVYSGCFWVGLFAGAIWVLRKWRRH